MRKFFPAMLVLTLACHHVIAQTNVSSSAANNQPGSSNKANEERNIKTAVASFNAMQAGDFEAAFKDYDKNILSATGGGSEGRSIPLDSIKMNSVTRYAQRKAAFPDGSRQIISTMITQ